MYHRHAHFDTPLPYKTASSKKQTKHTKHTWSLSLANATSVSLNQKIFAKVFVRGCSSNGRARALHARGTGIDTLLLHILFLLGFQTKRQLRDLNTKRQLGDLNPCGQSPADFKSASLTTRTSCPLAIYTISSVLETAGSEENRTLTFCTLVVL